VLTFLSFGEHVVRAAVDYHLGPADIGPCQRLADAVSSAASPLSLRRRAGESTPRASAPIPNRPTTVEPATSGRLANLAAVDPRSVKYTQPQRESMAAAFELPHMTARDVVDLAAAGSLSHPTGARLGPFRTTPDHRPHAGASFKPATGTDGGEHAGVRAAAAGCRRADALRA
jgi:hypothetical protein